MATAAVGKEVKDKRTDEQIAEDKANQLAAQDNKTPEQQAAEAILKDELVNVSGTTYEKLTTVVRYLNRDKIQVRGETWFKKNLDILYQDTLTTLVDARHKAIVEGLKKKEDSDLNAAFKMLIKRGLTVPDAYARVYGK